jgi:hypothetical protein
MNKELLTTSEIACHNRCPRRRYYAYVLLRRPIRKSTALSLGSFFHAGMDAWWEHDTENALHWAKRRANESEHATELNPFALAKANAMLTAYDAAWARDKPRPFVSPAAIEQRFIVPISNPDTDRESRLYEFGGSIDKVLANTDGSTTIVEHKTTNVDIAPGSSYFQFLAIDSQVSGYFIGANGLGYDVKECLYDVAAKPRHEQLSATPEEQRKYTKKEGKLYAGQRESDETLDEFTRRIIDDIVERRDAYFRRVTITRTDDDLLDFRRELWVVAHDIHQCKLTGIYPQRTTGCKAFGTLCEYFGVCTRTQDIDDDSIFRKVTSKHEELER